MTREFSDLLLNRFTFRQTGGDGTSRLGDPVALSWDRLGLDPAIMFVAPYYQIYRVVEHAFRDRILGSMLDSAEGIGLNYEHALHTIETDLF